MDWRRWHRVIKVAVVLAMVVTLILLSSLVGASPDTETRRPDAVGDETNLIPNTGVNYAAVDEATSDDDITYVESDATDTYLGMPTTSSTGLQGRRPTARRYQ